MLKEDHYQLGYMYLGFRKVFVSSLGIATLRAVTRNSHGLWAKDGGALVNGFGSKTPFGVQFTDLGELEAYKKAKGALQALEKENPVWLKAIWLRYERVAEDGVRRTPDCAEQLGVTGTHYYRYIKLARDYLKQYLA